MTDEPKKPRARTDNRDVFVTKDARPVPPTPPNESWAGDTGTEGLAFGDTPVELETEDAAAETRLRARVKKTASTTEAIRGTVETTQAGVDTLRFENRRDVQRVENKIGLVDAKVEKMGQKLDEHTGVMMRVVGTVGKMDGTLSELVKSADQHRQKETITFGARVDIDRVEAIAEIKDEADAKKQRRAAMWRIVRIVGAILAAGATVLVTHYAEHC